MRMERQEAEILHSKKERKKEKIIEKPETETEKGERMEP